MPWRIEATPAFPAMRNADQAACAGLDPQFDAPDHIGFNAHPGEWQRVQAARRVCDGCPVRVECREYAEAQRAAGLDLQGVYDGVLYPVFASRPVDLRIACPAGCGRFVWTKGDRPCRRCRDTAAAEHDRRLLVGVPSQRQPDGVLEETR